LYEVNKRALGLVKELRKYDPVPDAQGGFPIMVNGKQMGVTKPGGHYKEMREFQRGMKKYMTRFVNECLKGDDGPPPSGFPRWADELADREIPEPIYQTPVVGYNEPFAVPERDHHGEFELRPPGELDLTAPKQLQIAGSDALKITAGAGALYATYRAIRMIPSLFPPLWPTIPVNAAVP